MNDERPEQVSSTPGWCPHLVSAGTRTQESWHVQCSRKWLHRMDLMEQKHLLRVTSNPSWRAVPQSRTGVLPALSSLQQSTSLTHVLKDAKCITLRGALVLATSDEEKYLLAGQTGLQTLPDWQFPAPCTAVVHPLVHRRQAPNCTAAACVRAESGVLPCTCRWRYP